MAWRCSGATNGELIDNLYGAKIIKDRRIVDAMKATDRKVRLGQERVLLGFGTYANPNSLTC